jgi:hypothetical protein
VVYRSAVGHELGRALLLADAVTPEAMSRALLASVRDKVSLVRALLTTEAVDPARLDEELARFAPDAPFQKHPVPVLDLVERLPARLCEALVAMPVRRDPRTGTVDVALADALDTHAADEIAFYLGAPVRVVRAPLAALEEGIARTRSPRAGSSPSMPPPSRSMRGTPIVSIDSVPPDHASTVSERPMPLVQHGSDAPDGASAASPQRGLHQEDIPIPLSRRTFIPRITAQPDVVEEEEPVVELRRSKTPSTQSMPAVRPEARAEEPKPAPAPVAAATPLHQLLRDMTRATARDPLMELVLLAIRPVAPRVALFAAKKEAYVGWMCTSEFGDRAALADVRIDVRMPSVFATTAGAGTFLGPLLRIGQHATLFNFVKAPQAQVVAVAVRAAGKPVVIALAYDLADPHQVLSVMTEVGRVAGETLEKIVLSARGAPLSKR